MAVAADGALVVLRGKVESFGQRRGAADDARKIEGVAYVENELKVSLRGSDRRSDDEIRGAALQSLIWDVDVPSDSVEVRVQDGWVTLKGAISIRATPPMTTCRGCTASSASPTRSRSTPDHRGQRGRHRPPGHRVAQLDVNPGRVD